MGATDPRNSFIRTSHLLNAIIETAVEEFTCSNFIGMPNVERFKSENMIDTTKAIVACNTVLYLLRHNFMSFKDNDCKLIEWNESVVKKFREEVQPKAMEQMLEAAGSHESLGEIFVLKRLFTRYSVAKSMVEDRTLFREYADKVEDADMIYLQEEAKSLEGKSFENDLPVCLRDREDLRKPKNEPDSPTSSTQFKSSKADLNTSQITASYKAKPLKNQ